MVFTDQHVMICLLDAATLGLQSSAFFACGSWGELSVYLHNVTMHFPQLQTSRERSVWNASMNNSAGEAVDLDELDWLGTGRTSMMLSWMTPTLSNVCSSFISLFR